MGKGAHTHLGVNMSRHNSDLPLGSQDGNDKRDLWQRPTLRRVGANSAESGSGLCDDGQHVGCGAAQHPSASSSDIQLKHNIAVLGHLNSGLGFYRFSYKGSDETYVGVMAQEVQAMMPEAVVRDSDGYLRVFYDKLGLKFLTYDEWLASGAQVPTGLPRH